MLTEYVATGEVTAGQLKVRNRKAFDEAMQAFREGETVITIEHAYATRSEQQNRWYWGEILRRIAESTREDTRCSRLELHEFCKRRFNPKLIMLVDEHGEIKGEEVIGQSTTKLNKLTFGDYCEAIRQWARDDLGVVIPDPDPDWRERGDDVDAQD